MRSEGAAPVPYLHRVQYYETDQMGIVHHSNYIRWFEEARTDLLAQAGIAYAEMERRGIIIPVLQVECEYKAMTRYGETVRIVPSIVSFTGLRMSLRYEVYGDSGALNCSGGSRHCFLGRDMKPLRLKVAHADVHALLESLVVA